MKNLTPSPFPTREGESDCSFSVLCNLIRLHLSLTREVRLALSEVEGSASACASKLRAG